MHYGQGESLPASAQCDGEWLQKPALFLYRAASSHGAAKARAIKKVEFKDGSYAIGFDADRLADEFRVEVSALLQANAGGELQFLGLISTLPRREGPKAAAFVFELGDQRGVLNVDMTAGEGNGLSLAVGA